MTSSQAERLSNKAEKFLNKLNTEIEQGWTGHGQTNQLLGRITMRTYIFHHVMYGDEPLTGDSLIKEVLTVAKALPGYKLWCRHQNEIENRVSEWVNCIEKSHYFHYGEQFEKYKSRDDRQEQKLDQQLTHTRRLIPLLRKNVTKVFSSKTYSLTYHQRQKILVQLTPDEYRCMLLEHLNRYCRKLNNKEWALLMTIWEFRTLIVRAAWSEVTQMFRNQSA